MATFSISTDIGAPPSRVWDVISGVERWHEWTPSIRRVRRFNRGALGVGSWAVVRQPRLPPALWRVISLDEGRQFTWVSVAPGLHVVGFHGVEAAPGGSRATLSLDYRGVLGGVVARLLRTITERYLAFEAEGLRKRSESAAYHV